MLQSNHLYGNGRHIVDLRIISVKAAWRESQNLIKESLSVFQKSLHRLDYCPGRCLCLFGSVSRILIQGVGLFVRVKPLHAPRLPSLQGFRRLTQDVE